MPHARAKLRKWRVTNLHLALLVGGFLLLNISSALVVWSLFSGEVDTTQIEQLRAENEALSEANRGFEENLRNLQAQLSDYESRTRDLAIVAGLEDLGSRDAGAGGEAPFPNDLTSGDLEFTAYRVERLADRLNTVEHKLEERLSWISATPAIVPVKGVLTSSYGNRRDPITGARSFHPAVDIAAPPGRPVVATGDGLVIRSGRIGGLGNAVYLSHGFGITTRYGHMSRLAVEPGQRVQRGEVIGYVGNSGRSTGYHLHYEVHVDGEPINPLAYVLDGTFGAAF